MSNRLETRLTGQFSNHHHILLQLFIISLSTVWITGSDVHLQHFTDVKWCLSQCKGWSRPHLCHKLKVMLQLVWLIWESICMRDGCFPLRPANIISVFCLTQRDSWFKWGDRHLQPTFEYASLLLSVVCFGERGGKRREMGFTSMPKAWNLNDSVMWPHPISAAVLHRHKGSSYGAPQATTRGNIELLVHLQISSALVGSLSWLWLLAWGSRASCESLSHCTLLLIILPWQGQMHSMPCITCELKHLDNYSP